MSPSPALSPYFKLRRQLHPTTCRIPPTPNIAVYISARHRRWCRLYAEIPKGNGLPVLLEVELAVKLLREILPSNSVEQTNQLNLAGKRLREAFRECLACANYPHALASELKKLPIDAGGHSSRIS